MSCRERDTPKQTTNTSPTTVQVAAFFYLLSQLLVIVAKSPRTDKYCNSMNTSRS